MLRVARRIRVAVATLALALLGAPGSVRAEESPIQDNRYSLEIFQGPLLAPGRITGLAGATTAMAQSIEGVYNNAAAPAVREATSVDHFEWEPTGGIAFPGAYGGTDFNNRGEHGIERQIERNRELGVPRATTVETTDRFLYLNGGLWGQIGDFGLTATGDMLRYDVAAQSEENPSLALSILRAHVVGAYGFLRNQLCVGAGVRMAYVNVSEVNNPSADVISMFGAAPQAGLIVKPEDQPFRLGLTARMPVSALNDFNLVNLITEEQPNGVTIRRAGTSFILPNRIVLPWEVEAGIAYQLGPRPLNPRWIDPIDHRSALRSAVAEKRRARLEAQQHEIAQLPSTTPLDRMRRRERLRDITREEAATRATEDLELADADQRLLDERKARYLNWPREHVLLLASVLMTGSSSDAVALEGFIDQRRELVGERVSFSPRFAVESEAVPNLLKTRAGAYLEPSRFADGSARQHFTVGFDVRVLRWDVFGLFPDRQWRISAFLDVSERYQNFGVGAGVWH